MQTHSPLTSHNYGDSDQNSDLSGDRGNGNLTVLDVDNEYFLSVPTSSHHGPGSSGSTGGSTGSTSTITSDSTSSFVININWDASVSSAPAGFTAGVIKAVQFLESQFSNPCTITIDVGYGEVLGSALGGGVLGESETYLSSISYTALADALKSHATTTADQSAVATLPASNPTGGTFWASTAEEEALGLLSASSSPVGYAGFSSSFPFTYDDSSGVAGGTFDFNGVVLHELTEVMGRMLLDGGSIGSTSNSDSPLDLYHYSSADVRDFSFSTPGYLSTDGGVTDSGDLNTVGGGDPGDWASSMGNDAFDAFGNSGVVNVFSADDLTAMNLLGWEPTGSSARPPPPSLPPSQPTGVSLSPMTTSIAGAQSASGLTANSPIATVAQVGGTSGDSYSYTLSGSGAGSFALATSNNVASLSAGASGVTGGANGALYSLTLTATDTTDGMSSPASAADVVVGSSGNDTINLAALVGSGLTATPSFVFGLGGSDTIDGTGMTSKLWIVGGAGADVMTGGSGVNDYIYGATSDSSPAASDTITDFHAASDLIDLTGLGNSLSWAGKLPASITTGHGKHAATTNQVLPAHSFGWQTSGGNTFVYVNTGSGSVAVGAANMKIELQSSVSLTSSNFLHH